MRKNVNRRFFLSYLTLILGPLCIGLIIYISTIAILIDKELQSIKSEYLEVWQSSLDTQFYDINKIAANIFGLDEINSLFEAKDSFSDMHYYVFADNRPILLNYKLSNDLIIDYFIYMYNPNIIVSSFTTFQIPFFYNYIFTYNDVDYQQWTKLWEPRNQIALLSEQLIEYEKIEYNAVTYIYPDSNIYGTQRANIFFMVDIELMKKDYLYNIENSKISSLFIQSKDGKIISALYGDKTIADNANRLLNQRNLSDKFYLQENNKYILPLKSETNDFNYVLVIENSEVFHHLKTEITLLSLLIFLGFSISVLFVLYYAKVRWRKIGDLLNTININTDYIAEEKNYYLNNKDLYTILENRVKALQKNYNNLDNTLKIQNPLFCETIISVLLLDSIDKTKIDNKILQNMFPAKNEKSYTVCIVKKTNAIIENNFRFEDFNSFHSWINEASKFTIEDSIFVQIRGDGIWVIPSPVNKEKAFEYVRQACLKLNKLCQEKEITGLTFCIGEPISSIYDISQSFKQASQCSENNLYENKTIIMFTEQDFSSKWCYYPAAIEMSLINAVKQTNVVKVKDILNEIYEKNIISLKINYDSLIQLYEEIVGTIRRIISTNNELEESIDLKKIKEELDGKKHTNPGDSFLTIEKIFIKIIKTILNHKSKYITRLSKEILHFINKNYMLQDMSLQLISDKFNITPSFVSQIFRQSNQENFITYLTRIRIENSYKLLKDQSLSVNEVANLVGYNNDVSFRRAFKRITGVSPKYFNEKGT